MQAFSSHDIFQTLYQQIMLLELKPGSTLRENALCEQFGVSRTPVRRPEAAISVSGRKKSSKGKELERRAGMELRVVIANILKASFNSVG